MKREQRRTQINFRCTASFLERARAASKLMGCSIADIMDTALTEWVQKNESAVLIGIVPHTPIGLGTLTGPTTRDERAERRASERLKRRSRYEEKIRSQYGITPARYRRRQRCEAAP